MNIFDVNPAPDSCREVVGSDVKTQIRAVEESMHHRSVLTFLILFLFSMSWAAFADDQDRERDTRLLDDRLSFRLLAGVVNLNSQVAAGRNLGALIDLEDILGFDEQIATFGFEGMWRFSKNGRHSLHLQYGDFDRDASAQVEASVPILDLTFVGDLHSSFVNQVGSVEYQYSFINHNKTEAGVTGGLAIYKYDLAIEGQVIFQDNPDETRFRKDSVGVLAPVPAIGFFINQAFNPNLVMEIRASFIDLEIGEHNGRIFWTWLNLTWYFSRHFGAGVGLAGSDVLYDKNSSSEKLKVELRQTSLSFVLTAVF